MTVALHSLLTPRFSAAPPAPAPPADTAKPSLFEDIMTAGVGGAGGALAGTAATYAGLYGILPAETAILAHTALVPSLIGLLQFAVFSQIGTGVAVAGAAVIGLAAGALATRPTMDAHLPGFLMRPTSAIRDGAAAIGHATSRNDAVRGGAQAGWKAGRTLGAVAGGIQGVASGYAVGMLAAGLIGPSTALAFGGALGGAVVGGAALAFAGKYIGGAIGAAIGAGTGALGFGKP